MSAYPPLHNINFQLLLKQHGGNMSRAMQAWHRICQLGGFGNVPPSYAGGLDLQSLRTALDEQGDYRRYEATTFGEKSGEMTGVVSPTLSDDIARIEDIASGDSPK
jgi:hypothetical protein